MPSKWYAVSAPFKALFTSWPECERAIKGVKGIKFKSFKTAEEARAFMDGTGAASRVRAVCDSDTSSASAAPPPSSIDTLSAVAAAAHLEASSSAGGKRKRPLETGAQSHMPKLRKEARRSATLYYDGGSRGNPGISGAGAILYDAEGVEMWRGRKFVGRAATNNEAEYNGLILGLEAALVRGVTDMKVRGDSELVAKQMTGQYKVKSEKLESLHMIAKSLMKDFTSFEITNVPREENSIADMLANEAMDLR